MDVTDEEDVKVGTKYIEDIDDKHDILVNKFVYGAHGSLLPYANLFVVPDMLRPAIRQAVTTQILPQRNTLQRILLNLKCRTHQETPRSLNDLHSATIAYIGLWRTFRLLIFS